MITIIIHAGLANKMFQYAFYKGLECAGYDAAIDQKLFTPTWDFEDILLTDVFPNLHYKENNKLDFAKRSIYLKSFWGKVARRTCCNLPNYRLVKERTFSYDQAIVNEFTECCAIYGLWQCEKYFSKYREIILEEFTFKSFIDQKNIECANNIAKSNSVAIHIRKGADYKHLSDTCSLEYYQEGIRYIKDRIANPVFFVFTDNKEWVKENFKNIDYMLCDWNPVSGKESFRDIQLMSLCKHNIIANSSFSWWGAWLNHNEKKIIIVPKTWFGNDSKFFENEKDIVPTTWIRI